MNLPRQIRQFVRRISLAAAIASSLFFCCSQSQGPGIEKITILFTNDLSGRIKTERNGRGGLARIASEVKKVRAENPNTILLDAGDAAVGTAFTTETKGEAVFKVMNASGYDAMVFGNHEFDLGKDQARKYMSLARFPILACNIRDEQGKAFAAEYKIFNLAGMRLAVIGIANPKTTNLVDQSGIDGLKFLAPESELRRVQAQIAGQADVIVLLSHQGIGEDIGLAYRISGIPLIVGGHSEVKIKGLKVANKVNIAQAGDNGYYLGRVDFFWDSSNKKAYSFKGHLINITRDIPEDGAVKQVIEQESKSLPPGLDKVIGKNWLTVNRIYLGFWMAELLKAETGADFGIINSGGVRSSIYRGEVTVADVYDVMPFNDRLASFEMEGADLLRVKSLRGFYFSRGPRITAGKNYKVASIDYLLRIHDFPGAKNEIFHDALLRDKMIGRMERDRGVSGFWGK